MHTLLAYWRKLLIISLELCLDPTVRPRTPRERLLPIECYVRGLEAPAQTLDIRKLGGNIHTV